LLNQSTYAVLTKSAQCIYNLHNCYISLGPVGDRASEWGAVGKRARQTWANMFPHECALASPLQNRRWKGALERRTDRRRTGVATDGPGRCSGMQLSTWPDIFPPDIYPRLVLGLGPRTVVIIYFPRWWFSGKGAAGRGQMSCYREGSDCAADDKQCTAR